LVFAITIALGFIYRGFATYLPSWMAQRADVLSAPQVVRGGLIASLVYAVGFFGQWFGGHAGSRARPERLYALLLAATAGLLAASFFASGWPLVLILAAFSFVHFSTQPMDNIFTGKYTSLDRRGLGYGVSFALSFGFGSFAAWSGGAVVDAAGGQLRYISLLLCGAAVLATVCGVALAALADRLRR
jgi:predicted MFS family arabinose efflux permease